MVFGWAREQGVEVSLVSAKLLLLVRPPFATPQPRHPLARWRAECLFCKFAISVARSACHLHMLTLYGRPRLTARGHRGFVCMHVCMCTCVSRRSVRVHVCMHVCVCTEVEQSSK